MLEALEFLAFLQRSFHVPPRLVSEVLEGQKRPQTAEVVPLDTSPTQNENWERQRPAEDSTDSPCD